MIITVDSLWLNCIDVFTKMIHLIKPSVIRLRVYFVKTRDIRLAKQGGSDSIAPLHTGTLWVERKYTALSHARFTTEARRSRAVSIVRLDQSFF